MYQIGDFVMKARTGICRIQNIGELTDLFPGQHRLYYMMIPSGNAKTEIFLPVDQGSAVLRNVMSKKEAEELLRSIPAIPPLSVENERLREQQYQSTLGSNDPCQLAAVIKTLYVRKEEKSRRNKKTDFKDKAYFDTAEKLLYSEMAFALGVAAEDIPGLIAAAAGA